MLGLPVRGVLVGPPSVTGAPPSVPGAFRISLEVSDDTPVTAHPAQLVAAPVGCADDITSFSIKGRARLKFED